MPECPVCGTQFSVDTQQCSVCGWDLTPLPPTADPELSAAWAAKMNQQLAWARKIWARSHPNSSPENPQDAIARLETRFAQFHADLEQAAQERAYLQSQLQWVLYRLEAANLDQLQPTLSQLMTWLGTNYFDPRLRSEVGIDYSPLQNLLAAGEWRKADDETWTVILKAAGRDQEGWLQRENIEQFPATDLQTIDQLWQDYSDGKFGFSVQREIWESVDRDYNLLCDRVGWRVGSNWIYRDQLCFHLNAPLGHFPAIAWRRRACYGVGSLSAAEIFAAFISQITQLN